MSGTTCSQCGYANDHTRVFCQNCGTRLETSPEQGGPGNLFIPPTQPDAPRAMPPARKAQKTPSRTIQKPARGGSVFGQIVALLVWSAILACLIQMARTPGGIPPSASLDEPAATALFDRLKLAAGSSGPTALPVLPQQINNYLNSRVIPVAADSKAFYQAEFVRLYIVPGNGAYRLGLEEKIFGHPVYLYLDQVPVVLAGASTVKSVGGGVGRIPVHPALLPILEKIITPAALKNIDALSSLQKTSAIVINPQTVTFSWNTAPQP